MVNILGFNLELPTESWIMILIAFICCIFNAGTSIAQLIYYSSDENKEKKFKDVISDEMFYFAYTGFILSLVVILGAWTLLAWKFGRRSVICDANNMVAIYNGWFTFFLLVAGLFCFAPCFILWYYSIVDEESTVQQVLDKFDAKALAITTLVVGFVCILLLLFTSERMR